MVSYKIIIILKIFSVKTVYRQMLGEGENKIKGE